MSSSQSVPSDPKALTSLPFIEAIKLRRSIYALDATSPISDAKITQLVKDTLLHVPSAFNSQSTRAVVVVGEEHRRFWNMISDVHEADAKGDKEKWERSKPRFDGFLAAYGSIVFFEDSVTIKQMQDNAPAYATLFPGWSEHSSGMHQMVLWTALDAEGLGANLQHYQYVPEVETKAREMYGLPEGWVMKAQLVFGGMKEGRPTEGKPKLDTAETIKVFGAKQ